MSNRAMTRRKERAVHMMELEKKREYDEMKRIAYRLRKCFVKKATSNGASYLEIPIVMGSYIGVHVLKVRGTLKWKVVVIKGVSTPENGFIETDVVFIKDDFKSLGEARRKASFELAEMLTKITPNNLVTQVEKETKVFE